MVARINTVAFQGVDVRDVDVQVQISNGMPAFTIVGLPDKAVAESRERVRSALHALGISLPPKRLTVNLAPADLAKEGSHFDLPIALGLLAAMDVLPKEELAAYTVLGELSLDGAIRSVAGVLPAALHASSNDNPLICPADCGGEAAWAGDIDILAPGSLLQLINHIKGTQVMNRPAAKLADDNAPVKTPDLSDVRGQEIGKRALEIAAAGGHNLMMIGPPGSGKSMLASCLPGILPPLTPKEALEVSMIHSLAGTLPGGGLMKTRPYRDPHHSASLPALIGGGTKAKPGEISLAHNGVLFLDELPEFARGTLESLRQPLETGETLVARVQSHVTYPARFQLIAAMNPCRCGYLGDPDQECTRAPRCALDYQAKLSGPLLDRIDIQVDVPPVSVADLGAAKTGEPSAAAAARVAAARDVQRARNNGQLNAYLTGEELETLAPLEDDARALFLQAAETLKLSARAYHRLWRVARTIADLAGAPETISKNHVAEALGYRRLRIS
ncbi:MAG: YifB family Mg chelatase-like AAA ATPase [Rhodospirillales bacterium]|nr:YifB family Mg chelatase-like AAA ATPase [Rhodospirillales bacterium]